MTESFNMLLRIILGDNNIKKLSVAQLPEDVEEFKCYLKTALEIEGDLVLQYQDPEFDMELCNLDNMSDLPKDKATLKVHIKAFESYHTDSTLDTASLSSSIEESTSGPSQTCTIPHPFPIPTFSYDVELRLRAANEAFVKNGDLFDPPKGVKSDILEKIAEAVAVYTRYPGREEIDAVAQALVIKHPCLKDPGSVFGWYSWKFSLGFKFQNFRQKLQAAGCPELTVNKRPLTPSKSKKLKKAKKSEVNFLPGWPEGKSEGDLEQDRLALIDEMKKKNIDWKLVDQMMASTFSLRRKEIIEDEPLVALVKERWPALFCKRQIEAEFARLTSTPLMEGFLSGLDAYLDRFLELLKTKRSNPEIARLIRQVEDGSSSHKKRTVLLLGLPHFLKEDGNLFGKTVEATDDEQAFCEDLKVGLVTVKDGNEILAVSVILEESVVISDLQDIPSGVAMLLGLLYSTTQRNLSTLSSSKRSS